MKLALVALAVLGGAFGAGYGWMYFQHRSYRQSAEEAQRQLEAKLAEANTQLRLARLQGQLGLVLVEVERSNFGNAKDIAAKFFDELRAAADAAQEDSLRKRLQAALQRRDEVTAALAALKPESADMVRRMFADLMGTGR